MLHFLRNIRRNLLTEKKLGNYLVYAFGEIILVVFGILIALNINNANEARKQRAQVDSILEEIHKNLVVNIERCTDLIEGHRDIDSLIQLVLSGELTEEDYRNPANAGLQAVALNYYILIVQDDGFEKLMQNIDAVPDEYDHVVNDLKTLHISTRNSVETFNEKLATAVDNLAALQREEKSWYADWAYSRKPTEAVIEYLLEDPAYRNHVAYYSIIAIRNHYPAIQQFRSRAINSYRAISELLELEEPAKENRPAFIVNAEDYVHLVGTYSDGVRNIVISIEDDRLWMDLNGRLTQELFPLPGNRFHLAMGYFWQTITDDDGKVISIGATRQNDSFLLNKEN